MSASACAWSKARCSVVEETDHHCFSTMSKSVFSATGAAFTTHVWLKGQRKRSLPGVDAAGFVAY